MRIFGMFLLLGWLLAACGSGTTEEVTLPPPTETATLVPTSTNTPRPSATATPPEATPELTPEVTALVEVFVEPAEGQVVPPPINIDLPTDWNEPLTDTVLIQDLDDLRLIPFTAYSGPVTGGTGFIVVLYGFPSFLPQQSANLGFDGLRLLRLAVTDVGCNIGVDPEPDREYQIGDRVAVGSYFQAVSCPESVDTRGWFAALEHQGVNIAFYAYAEPIEAMDGSAEAELQAILDTVEFDLGTIMITATPSP